MQLPPAAGDAVSLDPAPFHGAGNNRSADVRRTAVLLQVCGACGRAVERVDRVAVGVDRVAVGVDRVAVSNAVHPVLRRRSTLGRSPPAPRRRGSSARPRCPRARVPSR